MYIIDKFIVKTTFLNSCAMIKGVLHIGMEVVCYWVYAPRLKSLFACFENACNFYDGPSKVTFNS